MSDPIVSFDEAAMRGELKELVRQTVEDTLNALLEEEADDLIGADRYERTADREAYRAGHYERGLTTTSGQVILKMPGAPLFGISLSWESPILSGSFPITRFLFQVGHPWVCTMAT